MRIAELEKRLAEENVGEVLLALSTDMEGDATAGYLGEILARHGVKVSRLAFGLPAAAIAFAVRLLCLILILLDLKAARAKDAPEG